MAPAGGALAATASIGRLRKFTFRALARCLVVLSRSFIPHKLPPSAKMPRQSRKLNFQAPYILSALICWVESAKNHELNGHCSGLLKLVTWGKLVLALISNNCRSSAAQPEGVEGASASRLTTNGHFSNRRFYSRYLGVCAARCHSITRHSKPFHFHAQTKRCRRQFTLCLRQNRSMQSILLFHHSKQAPDTRSACLWGSRRLRTPFAASMQHYLTDTKCRRVNIY